MTGVFLFVALSAAPASLCPLKTAALPDTFYVSMTGSDSNDGTASHPWRTLQHAADVVTTPGDVVLVADGNYTGFNSGHSGIHFIANGAHVVIYREGSYSGLDHINIEGHDDIVVAGFTVRDAARAGIRVVNAEHVIVRGNTVGSNGRWGIFSGFAPGLQVIDNHVWGSETEHGIYLSNSYGPMDQPLVRGNLIHDNYGSGIQFNGDCFAGGDGTLEGGIIENNVIYHNGWKGLSIISAPGTLIQNNVIYENRQNGIGAAGIHLVDEPGCSKPTIDAIVVNNTIHEIRMAGIRINDGSTSNILFNNLIVSPNPVADEVGGNSIGPNLTTSMPEGFFVDVAEGDYHLSKGSSAIDAGLAVFSGASAPSRDHEAILRDSAPDAGAFEFDMMPVELGATGSSDESDLSDTPHPVSSLRLSPPYPNPATQESVLRFELLRPAPVRMGLYDVQGRRLEMLTDGMYPMGRHAVTLSFEHLPPGLYFVRIEAGPERETTIILRAR